MKKIDFKSFFEKFNNESEARKSNFEKSKINKNKIKQYSLVIIACMLFAFGYANYHPETYENDERFAIVTNENADMIGDVELVSSGSVVENESIIGTAPENNDIIDNQIVKNSDVNQDDLDYFEAVRIERDAMYSRMLETYNKMIDNNNLAETQKSIAIQEIEKITNNQNAIMISENLIKNKGYEDVVVFANADIINIIVKSPALSNEDIGKIQNIIEREFKVSLENVNISNKN